MDIPETPSLIRRAGSIVYEALLLVGVLAFAELPVLILKQNVSEADPALILHLHQLWLFLILGAYFVVSWREAGQTLAMKTWRIKLVAANGTQVSMQRAIARYLFAWMWFVPGMVFLYVLDLHGWVGISLIPLGMLLWATTIWLNPERQFLHDKLAGTRLVDSPRPAIQPATPK